jgi:hypothetical protein
MRSLLFLLISARARKESEEMPAVSTAPVFRKVRRVMGEMGVGDDGDFMGGIGMMHEACMDSTPR